MDDLEDRKSAKNIDLTKENVQKLTGDLGKAGQKGRFRQIMCNNYIVKNGKNLTGHLSTSTKSLKLSMWGLISVKNPASSFIKTS
jgi:hypothetical protein